MYLFWELVSFYDLSERMVEYFCGIVGEKEFEVWNDELLIINEDEKGFSIVILVCWICYRYGFLLFFSFI